jgi:SEP domain
MSRITGLKDLNDKAKAGKDDDKNAGNTLYTGSGQNVFGNPNGPSRIPQHHDDSEGEDDDDDLQGKGYSVSGGNRKVMDKVFRKASSTHPPDEPHSPACMIKFYKNGFIVEDGDLRLLDDPANQEFLRDISRGEVPKELRKMHKSGLVHVNVEDHRDVDYVPPPYKAFAGAGMYYELQTLIVQIYVYPQ